MSELKAIVSRLGRWHPIACHTQRVPTRETDDGQIGDCLRAAVASVLGWEKMDDVPHFATYGFGCADDDETRHGWWWALIGWCASLDPPCEVREVKVDCWSDFLPPDIAYILSGPSPRGPWNHVVVAANGEMIWDPHPSREGLAGPATGAYIIRPITFEGNTDEPNFVRSS